MHRFSQGAEHGLFRRRFPIVILVLVAALLASFIASAAAAASEWGSAD